MYGKGYSTEVADSIPFDDILSQLGAETVQEAIEILAISSDLDGGFANVAFLLLQCFDGGGA